MVPINEVIVGPSRLKAFSLFALPLLLIGLAAGLGYYQEGKVEGWIIALLIGLVSFVVITQLLLRRTCYLRLTPEGVTIRIGFRKSFYTWDAIEEFRVVEKSFRLLPMGVLVVFDFPEGSRHRTALRQAAHAVTGYHDSFANVFDRDAEELAAMLNQWREQFTTGAA